MTSVAYDNPEGVIESRLRRFRLKDHGHGVAAGAGAGTIADGYVASDGRPSAVNAIAELQDTSSVGCLNSGVLAIARAGAGEAGDKPPALTVDGDGYARSLDRRTRICATSGSPSTTHSQNLVGKCAPDSGITVSAFLFASATPPSQDRDTQFV